jgi:hypothetical protein
MTTLVHISTFSIAILLISCSGQNNQVNKNEQQKDTLVQKTRTQNIENPSDLVKNYNGENNKLFVFVGHKISVDTLPYIEGSMDGGFKAKYLIVQKVFGNFSNDTIEFLAFDHYGIPPFSEYNDALLFVSADSGTYFHQKYQYNAVYQTKDGQWAGTYAFNDYEHEYNKRTKVKPVKIDFAQPVYYSFRKITEQGDTLTRILPKPYFKTVGDGAIAVYGNYVNDLFILKRDGVLTAREIFKNGKLTD